MSGTPDQEYMPSAEECAKRGRAFVSTPVKQSNITYQVAHHFISKYKYLTYRRLVPLTFYTDYRFYQLHGEQLTNLHYQKESTGAYTDELKPVVSHDVFTERVVDKHTAFKPTQHQYYADDSTPPFGTPDLDVRLFLEQIHSETRDVSTDALDEFGKNTPFFEQEEWENPTPLKSDHVSPMSNQRV